MLLKTAQFVMQEFLFYIFDSLLCHGKSQPSAITLLFLSLYSFGDYFFFVCVRGLENIKVVGYSLKHSE